MDRPRPPVPFVVAAAVWAVASPFVCLHAREAGLGFGAAFVRVFGPLVALHAAFVIACVARSARAS
jgi:hypothetical protein